MLKPLWTKPQSDAIYARGGSLLVSAAAGSGKTAVLVERVVSLLCDAQQPVDVSKLLVVTFSNAAAAEMKQRVSLRLSQEIAKQPENYYLQKQQAMLASANISTVHAFCLELIRQNYQNLSISSDFSLLNEAELALLKDEVGLEVLEKFYADPQRASEFGALVELLSGSRDDKKVSETVIKVYDFARAHPFYKQWLAKKLALYDDTLSPESTPWGKSILRYAVQALTYATENMGDSLDLIAEVEVLIKSYQPMFWADYHRLRSLLEACENAEWDSVVSGLRNFSFDRLGSVRGDVPEKETVKAIRDAVKKLVDVLTKSFFNATVEEFRSDITYLRAPISLLFEVVEAFGDKLDEEKRIRKKLDFSDLEHLTLELLAEEDGSLTQQAKNIASSYECVLVDEYQDTNEVQDLIFKNISRTEKNLFMVGDVKQSIYSFRLAMPALFLEKKEQYSPYNGVDFPATINLDTNFRSRSEVTQAVNFLFSHLMSRDVGDIFYDENETLKPGASFLPSAHANPELLLLQAEDYEGEESKLELEALAVAKKIAGMISSGYQVQDKRGGERFLRAVRPSDFCILLRTHRTKARAYVKALQVQGVSAWAENAGTFLQSREISMVLSLLRVLGNPLLDIEQAAVLLSVLCSFSNDELVEIRLEEKGASLYQCLHLAAQNGNTRAEEYLALLDSLRRFASSHSVDKLLMEIYNRTFALELVQAMPMGEGRHANLLLLMEYAAYYHSAGYTGLHSFLSLLERIEERGGDLSPANTLDDSANVVRVMSIHRSKGLEFPVVILADTAKEFNLTDLRENTLLHSEYGFACIRRNPDTLAQFRTMPMGAIGLEMKKNLLSEEMRVLYVALTRAKEKLILVGTIGKNLEKTLQNLVEPLQNGVVSAYRVGGAKSYLEWILLALFHHPSATVLREKVQQAQEPSQTLLAQEAPWTIRIQQATGEETTDESTADEITLPAEPALVALFEGRMNFSYPTQGQTVVPSKLAISAVARAEQGAKYYFQRRPKLFTQAGLTPAERGTAMHQFMQFSDYDLARESVANEIERLRKDEFLTPEQSDSLDVGKLSFFFQSPLAGRIFASETLHRELRFVTEFGKEELGHLYPSMDNESKVMLQGVADCVFLENGAAILLDYKTDRVQTLEELAQRYETQMRLYKKILTQQLELPIAQTILYSFHLSDWIAQEHE